MGSVSTRRHHLLLASSGSYETGRYTAPSILILTPKRFSQYAIYMYVVPCIFLIAELIIVPFWDFFFFFSFLNIVRLVEQGLDLFDFVEQWKWNLFSFLSFQQEIYLCTL